MAGYQRELRTQQRVAAEDVLKNQGLEAFKGAVLTRIEQGGLWSDLDWESMLVQSIKLKDRAAVNWLMAQIESVDKKMLVGDAIYFAVMRDEVDIVSDLMLHLDSAMASDDISFIAMESVRLGSLSCFELFFTHPIIDPKSHASGMLTQMVMRGDHEWVDRLIPVSDVRADQGRCMVMALERGFGDLFEKLMTAANYSEDEFKSWCERAEHYFKIDQAEFHAIGLLEKVRLDKEIKKQCQVEPSKKRVL